MLNRFIIVSSIAACASPAVFGQVEPHRDIQLTVEEGSIMTGVIDFDTPGGPTVTDTVRVYSRILGEGAISHFTDDPGFNAFSGTFTFGTLVGFDLMDHLRVWDPIEQNFDTSPTETMLINSGGSSLTTPDASDSPTFPIEGFFFASANSNGAIHQHINFFLNLPQSAGVYLLQIRVKTTGSNTPSEPVFILFSDDVPTETTEDAEQYIEDLVNGSAICFGDCDNSGAVDFNDLVCSLFLFGTDDPLADCDESGVVDFNDLVCELFSFGPCDQPVPE